jgi:hypothetical protein
MGSSLAPVEPELAGVFSYGLGYSQPDDGIGSLFRSAQVPPGQSAEGW